MHQSTAEYAARWIVPITRPPIHRGWIRLQRGRIVEVSSTAAPATAQDLGDVAILPGWVNAHTHLEFSDLATPIDVPLATPIDAPLATPADAPLAGSTAIRSLPAWIAGVVRHRAGRSSQTAAAQIQQRRAALVRGLDESAAAGVRLVAEIATDPWPLAEYAEHHPEVVALGEVLGLSVDRQRQTLAAAVALGQRSLPGTSFGLSPHAPYSTTTALVDAAVEACRQRGWPLAMHVAESREELELLDHGRGPFRQALESIGVWRDGLFPRPGGIDALLRQLAAAPRCLVVHGNYLTASQIEFLAGQSQMTVVHCPRTHAFFGHPPHPLAQLRRAGARVALGTDSRASNPDLNLWEEVRYLLGHRRDLSPAQILRMATHDGAVALGRPDCGCLEPGAAPGLLAVPTTASDPPQLWASLGPVAPTPLA